MVFAIEKAHNEHLADFQSLVERFRTKERLHITKNAAIAEKALLLTISNRSSHFLGGCCL